MQTKFASAEIDVIIHATESHQKILNIIHSALKIDHNKFNIKRVEGHYGNEIILMKAKLNTRESTELAYHIINALSTYDKRRLIDEFDSYIERNSLYIRISKQDLFRNKIVLDNEIKIRFRVKGFKPDIEFDNLKKILREEYG